MTSQSGKMDKALLWVSARKRETVGGLAAHHVIPPSPQRACPQLRPFRTLTNQIHSTD